jgi:hypothetical protein
MAQTSPVSDPGQRFEMSMSGFSILPPGGEGWCYRLITTRGMTFFKLPKLARGVEEPLSLRTAGLHVSSTMALSLKGLRDFGDPQTSDELKSLVDTLIREHVFAQVSAGIMSAEHRFRLLKASVATMKYAEANCVRFDALVEERGTPQEPVLVFLLNLPGNIVCRHPTASDVDLIWVGFIERFVDGNPPAADALKAEYEPLVQSLQFMTPR